jgi:hypothetical protein
MMSRFGVVFATALGAVVIAPMLTQAADVLPPPYGDVQQPKVATDAQALATLHQRGIARVSGFGRVGDYWEGEGMLAGKPVVAYVFADGALQIQAAGPGERVRTQSALAPQ